MVPVSTLRAPRPLPRATLSWRDPLCRTARCLPPFVAHPLLQSSTAVDGGGSAAGEHLHAFALHTHARRRRAHTALFPHPIRPRRTQLPRPPSTGGGAAEAAGGARMAQHQDCRCGGGVMAGPAVLTALPLPRGGPLPTWTALACWEGRSRRHAAAPTHVARAPRRFYEAKFPEVDDVVMVQVRCGATRSGAAARRRRRSSVGVCARSLAARGWTAGAQPTNAALLPRSGPSPRWARTCRCSSMAASRG